MSSTLNNKYAESFWKYCPSDILLLIFKRLDIKSLINCMGVTKYWSDTLHYYCQHYNLWSTMLEETINKKRMVYEEKSNLNEQELFFNASQWLNIKDSKILLHHEYNIEKIKNISVLKELLIVTYCKALNIFDIKHKKIIKMCDNNCLNYVETSSLIAELTLPNFEVIGYNILTLTNKLHSNVCECIEGKKLIFFDISIFKVHLNACYIIDIKNVLWVYVGNDCKWDFKVLARYYGNRESMIAIHIHDDDVYILLKSGDILKVDSNCKKFEKIFHIEIPLYHFDRQVFMFDKYSLIVEVPKDKAFDIYPQKERKQTVVVCPGLTCSLEHGPVIIMGYESGKVEIFLIDDLINGDSKPALFFYLQSYVNLESFRIKSLDVYEDRDGHHLFVATENNIYELLII